MSYYEDDFYEPSEYDEMVEEFKEKLRASVKQEIKDEIERLKSELEEIKVFRSERVKYYEALKEAQQKANRAEAEYKRKAELAKREARSERAQELLRNISVVGYRPKAIYTDRPKCDKCDEHRKIHFKSPQGRECTEDCACATKIIRYEPCEAQLLRLTVNDKSISSYYTRVEVGYDYDIYDCSASVWEKEEDSFEKTPRYCTVFLEEANCQAYCDWLNEKEAQK